MAAAQELKRLSKLLAVMLRHAPQDFGLTPDAEGFVSVADLWTQVDQRGGGRYTYEDLLAVVEGVSSDKKRFEIRGEHIRALYGHSAVEVIYDPAVPPETLYHGTTEQALGLIAQHGLTAQSRQYVHVTTNRQLAASVGARHEGKTIILSIRAAQAHAAGIVFFHPEAEHYLAERIPPEFIDFV
jgi:putative RNA 2'-phosphotransferase